MRQTSFATVHCSLARSLEMIGDWWSPLILRDLSFGPQCFDDLTQDLGISRNLLTTRLRWLVKSGVVRRIPAQRLVGRHDYDLTEAGRELVPVLMALTAWGDRWTFPPGGPPVLYWHVPCQRVIAPTVSCPSCREPVALDDLEILGGSARLPSRGTMLLRAFIRHRQVKRGSPLGPLRPPGR
jgi:DNA-binding HxlR family transcriptional regulator